MMAVAETATPPAAQLQPPEQAVLAAAVADSLRYRNFDNAVHLAQLWCQLTAPADEEAVYCLADALFQAGRLHECRQHLLTTPAVPGCHFHSGKEDVAAARNGGHSFRCRFLLARCCVELRLLAEAETVLRSWIPRIPRVGGDTVSTGADDASPDGSSSSGSGGICCKDRAAALHLLGQVCVRSNRVDDAERCLRAASTLDPLLVTAVHDLASIGAAMPDLNNLLSAARVSGWQRSHCRSSKNASTLTAAISSKSMPVQNNENSASTDRKPATRTHRAVTESTATVSMTTVRASRIPRTLTARTAGGVVPNKAMSTTATTTQLTTTATVREKKRTRSGETIPAAPAVAIVDSVAHGDKRPTAADNGTDPHLDAVLNNGKLLVTLRTMCRALFQKDAHTNAECLQTLASLDEQVRLAPWSIHVQALAHFDMGEYELAAKRFKRLRQLKPFDCAGMDKYSTALWHMKDAAGLRVLVHDLFAANSDDPIAWCAAGNAFSLQREHENALSCFKKAVTIRPDYAYAHSLCGHEYHTSEAFDKAIVCFQSAVRANPRLYNAWYGLGMVYFKQEKWQLAEHHFQTALTIHRTSTVLHSFLGMTYHKQKRYDEAVKLFNKAIQLNRKNPQAHYRKAVCLSDMQQHRAAIHEFHETIALAPRESHVHLKKAAIHQQLGEITHALQHLMRALDLDPKNASHIKDAISRLAPVSAASFVF